MKKFLSFLLALVFVIGCIQVTVPAADNTNQNLITNGDFEESGGWSSNNFSRVTDPTGSEQGYVMRVGEASGDRSCSLDPISLESNTYYCFSAKIYRGGNTGAVYIDMLPEDDGSYLAGSQVGTDETGRWVTVSCIFNSGEHTTVRPHLATSNTNDDNWLSSTYFYFDDLVLTELDFPQSSTIGTPKASFNVDTDSTSASFAATDNGLYITALSSYITEPQEISLVSRISDKEVTWQYSNYETKTIANGTEHIVTFLSSDGAYQLRAVLTQQSGDGPIEFNQYITGLTDGISVAYSDIISANIAVKTDGEATLYRFSRSRVNDGSDPYFSQGVLTDLLEAGSTVFSSVENYYTVNGSAGSILPYQVLDIDGNHGVYFGYYWSFGKMLVRMNESNEVAFTAYLGENSTKRITRDANVELSIPGFFIGTYEGSVDDGSNQMKDWFWDYKMTRTLNENENEPYIEIGAINDKVAGIHTLFDIWTDLANYANILKLDWGWTVPDKTASFSELVETQKKWVPDEKYGSSMGIYDAIQEETAQDGIDQDVYLALYMAYTFEGVDIGTEEGRDAQLQALMDRMSPNTNDYGIGYEYWRSDFAAEASNDYDDHEGLLYILDEMIAYSDDFRYEHCMGGGSLKDFTTLERMTFMTTEDTALPLNHRMSLYANTYMINPLQLKADISMGKDKNTDGDSILDSGLAGYTDETYVKYALRTGMLGAMNITFNEAGYRYGNNLEIIKEHYDLYNNTHREILRNTDVYHILSAPTGWDYADWDGIEYYNPELNKGIVQLFKENAGAPNTKTIVLDGLDENAMYKLTFVDRTEQNTVKSGAQLMSEGITVKGMDTQYASEIIYIEAYETTETAPFIVSAVAINETQFKITISEPITIHNNATFALFLAKDGVVDNMKERSEEAYKETGTRYGGTMAAGTASNEFIWTIGNGGNATDAINAAIEDGYEVYFGINGDLVSGMINATTRAVDNDGDGFVPNLEDNHAHGVHGVKVEAYKPNEIISVTAINHTQIKFTTREAIKVPTNYSATFALFVAQDGVVPDFSYRYGGTISPVDDFANEFIWTIDSGNNATTIITGAVAAGNQVYFGINGTDTNGYVDPARAQDEYGNGFKGNIPVNVANRVIYGVEAPAFEPNTITSVTTISDTHLQIEFARPLASFIGTVYLGVLNDAGDNLYNDEGVLDDTVAMTTTLTGGKLVCHLDTDKAGMTEDARNIPKIVEAIEAAYSGKTAGIAIYERSDDEAGATINDNGYLEEVKDTDGVALKGTAKRTSVNKDICVASITLGVAMVGDKAYTSLDEAMQYAAGSEIDLLTHVSITDMAYVLNADVILDLNGYNLTVNNYFLPFGQIIDSKDGVGKLVIAKDKVKNTFADNGYLPLYDDGGYQFFAYEFHHVQKPITDPNIVQYSVGLGFTNRAAYALLIDDDNADIDFGVKMTITKPDGSQRYIEWIFSDELMQTFVEKNTTRNTAVAMTISGMERLGDATATAQAILISENFVVDLVKDMDLK